MPALVSIPDVFVFLCCVGALVTGGFYLLAKIVRFKFLPIADTARVRWVRRFVMLGSASGALWLLGQMTVLKDVLPSWGGVLHDGRAYDRDCGLGLDVVQQSHKARVKTKQSRPWGGFLSAL